MTVIGISGVARAGKDSIANILVEKYGYERRAFADLMKKMAYAQDPLLEGVRDQGTHITLAHWVDYHGWEKAKEHPEVRRTLQRLGTQVGRDLFGESFWIDQVTKDLTIESKVVFSDVRFPNEFEAIKGLGGQIWRVERPGIKAANDHVSEHALDGHRFDRIVYNSGEIRHLEEMVDRLMAVSDDPTYWGVSPSRAGESPIKNDWGQVTGWVQDELPFVDVH